MADRDRKDGDEYKGPVHVYDGIVEEDNVLPRWWLATFWGAIVFAVIYWLVYHTFPIAKLPLEAYGEEMARRAGSGGEVSNELFATMAEVPTEVEAGRALYETHCAVCHGQKGEGVIGPNLTDAAWLHGGDAVDIYRSVRDGIPSAGMPAWGAPLGEAATRQVSTYVVSIRGTNVPGKEPQGTPWVGGDEGAGEGGEPALEDEGAVAEVVEGVAADGEESDPEEAAADAPEGSEAAEAAVTE